MQSTNVAHINESSDMNRLTDFQPILKLTKIDTVYVWHVPTENKISPVSEKVYKTWLPIENCPTCEIGLVPEQFTVNVKTAVMKTSCQCGLCIEIDIQAPHLKVCDVPKKKIKSEINYMLRRLR